MIYKNHKCRRLLKRNLNKIVISKAFEAHPPKEEKYRKKLRKKKLDPIIVDENFVLVDGYCSYLIVKYHISFKFLRECGFKPPKIYQAKGLKVGKEKRE